MDLSCKPGSRARKRLKALDVAAIAGALLLGVCAFSYYKPIWFWYPAPEVVAHFAQASGIADGYLWLQSEHDHDSRRGYLWDGFDLPHLVHWHSFRGWSMNVSITDRSSASPPLPTYDGWILWLNLWPFGSVPVALWCVVRGRFWLVRYRRRATGRCLACGYNLTGNTSGQCPECGGAAPRA